MPTPALDRRPLLCSGLDIFLTAYKELQYDRPVGMAVGPIPWSSIERWATRHGIDDADDLAELVIYIRAMEDESMKRETAKTKTKEKKKGAKDV